MSVHGQWSTGCACPHVEAAVRCGTDAGETGMQGQCPEHIPLKWHFVVVFQGRCS